MFPLNSSENSSGILLSFLYICCHLFYVLDFLFFFLIWIVLLQVTNGVENVNDNNMRAIPYHPNNRPPPPLYSANTTMLSFNNVEQSYTRVVGQVYSRETVTTIYGPQTAFWVSCTTSEITYFFFLLQPLFYFL